MKSTDESRLPRRTFLLQTSLDDPENVIEAAKALSSPRRLQMLHYLDKRTANVSEIAEALDMPMATVNLHLNSLEKAGLVRTEKIAARRGVQRMCSRLHDIVVIHLPRKSSAIGQSVVRTEMPVGAFVDHEIVPVCGLLSTDGQIGEIDDPISFYEPGRFDGQLIWFSSGYVEYHFPYRSNNSLPIRLEVSMELCSEAVSHHQHWPSDIFIEVNGVDLGIWRSPGDFGGIRGKLTPRWWPEENSQYGLLKKWSVDRSGTVIDGRPLSPVTIEQLHLNAHSFVRIRVGVRSDAANVGGINIFGRGFGNHAQGIVMEIGY